MYISSESIWYISHGMLLIKIQFLENLWNFSFCRFHLIFASITLYIDQRNPSISFVYGLFWLFAGTAYAYDDAETSSDSDDEVLRRYQQSVQRAPSITGSVRSLRSNASSVRKGKGELTYPVHLDFNVIPNRRPFVFHNTLRRLCQEGNRCS